MSEFTIRCKGGSFVRVSLDKVLGFPNETSHFGGYDVEGAVELQTAHYYVKGELWFTTGEVSEFYTQLVQCWTDVKGTARLRTYETSLKLEAIFNHRGQVIIRGYFKEFAHQDNELKFEIESDQSFITETLDSLKAIVNRYGDLEGMHKE